MSAKAKTAAARREVWHAVGRREFLLRRPREAEVLEWMAEGKWTLGLNSVVDWRGVSSDDICGDGVQDQAPFDLDDRDEFLMDHIDVLADILNRVKEMILAKREAAEDAKKN